MFLAWPMTAGPTLRPPLYSVS